MDIDLIIENKEKMIEIEGNQMSLMQSFMIQASSNWFKTKGYKPEGFNIKENDNQGVVFFCSKDNKNWIIEFNPTTPYGKVIAGISIEIVINDENYKQVDKSNWEMTKVNNQGVA